MHNSEFNYRPCVNMIQLYFRQNKNKRRITKINLDIRDERLYIIDTKNERNGLRICMMTYMFSKN